MALLISFLLLYLTTMTTADKNENGQEKENGKRNTNIKNETHPYVYTQTQNSECSIQIIQSGPSYNNKFPYKISEYFDNLCLEAVRPSASSAPSPFENGKSLGKVLSPGTLYVISLSIDRKAASDLLSKSFSLYQ